MCIKQAAGFHTGFFSGNCQALICILPIYTESLALFTTCMIVGVYRRVEDERGRGQFQFLDTKRMRQI